MTTHTEQPADPPAPPADAIPPLLGLSLGLPMLAVLVYFIVQFWPKERDRSAVDEPGEPE